MSNLKIIEHSALAASQQIATLPPIAIQVLVIGTEVDSVALNKQTQYVELIAGADCCVKVGPDATTNAATTDYPVLTNISKHVGVQGGWIISVISGSGL